MRIQPRPSIAVGVFIGYAAVVTVMSLIGGVDYDEIGDTTENVRDAIVIPIAVGAVFLAAMATYLGWWRPALFENERAGSRWMLAVPVCMLLYGLTGVAGFDWDSPRTDVLPLLAVGVLLVGFSEEMVTRGLMIVGLRGGLKEPMVWLVSSLLFGLLHAINIVFGQAVDATLQQIVFAFLLGTAFYVTRRVTGTLLVCMVLHALWDFGTIGNEATDGTNYAGFFLVLTAVLGLVAVWRLLRSPAPAATADARPAKAVA